MTAPPPARTSPASNASRPAAAPPHAPLSLVTRGGAVDAIHYGSVAVVDRAGRLLFGAGDPWHVTTTRSALKPFQAIPLVARGGIERFGLSSEEVALLCSSHSGEERHMATAARILERAGNAPGDLQCGTHPPLFYDAHGRVPPQPPYSPLANNCSGKHAGMLAYCTLCGVPKATYLDFEHPLQQAIREAVSWFLATPAEELLPGVDGCSAPNYAVPLARIAWGYARLAAAEEDDRYGRAPRRLAEAMMAHPDMVSGSRRNDLAYMQAGRSDWVTKAGAEGLQAIGVRSAGLGIAVKVVDGAKRAVHPATVVVLEQLGLVDAEQRRALASWREAPVRNARGIVTGVVRPVAALQAGETFELDQEQSPRGDKG